jgi:hypothetical protein
MSGSQFGNHDSFQKLTTPSGRRFKHWLALDCICALSYIMRDFKKFTAYQIMEEITLFNESRSE